MSIASLPAPPGGAAFVVDHELRYLVAEGDALQGAGFRPEDLIGKSIFEALEPGLARRYETDYRHLLAGGSFAHEHESHGRSYLSRGVALRDPGGHIHAALVVSYDITDRTRAELLERRGEEMLSGLIENAPFGVVILDAGLRLRACNGAAEVAFGQAHLSIGSDFAQVLRSIWQEPFVAQALGRLEHTLRSGEPYVAQTLIGAPESIARHDWRIQRLILPDGTFGITWYLYDLSPIQRAEVVLASAARRHAFLVEFTDALASVSEAREVAAIAVERFCKHLGAGQATYERISTRGEDAAFEQGWRDASLQTGGSDHRVSEYGPKLLSALERNEVIALADVRQAVENAGDAAVEAFQRSAIAAVLTIPVIKDQRLVGVLAVHHPEPRHWTEEDLELAKEVAERIWSAVEGTLAQAARRQSEERLRELNHRKDEFFAILAHELRNPLAPIRAGLELLRLAGDSPESVSRLRGLMERQTAHLVRLVDDLLDVSRIDWGKIKLQRQVTNLSALVSSSVELHQSALEAGERELVIDLPSFPVRLDVDATRIVQVLSNLLHNAIKFTKPGDMICVAAAVDSSAESLLLTVIDSGAGISRELLPRVFDLFTQGDADSYQGGLGIGLSLAKRLVELHGGSLAAASDGPGFGSAFTVRLPIVSAAAPAAVATPAATAKPSVPRRVMVVDDNADAGNVLALLIEAFGGQIRVAYSGESALAQLDDFRPEVVFVDIIMPGMDGYETCRKIRAAMGTEVRIVALSGLGQERDRQLASRAGFDAHLTKPVEPEVLRRFLSDSESRSSA